MELFGRFRPLLGFVNLCSFTNSAESIRDMSPPPDIVTPKTTRVSFLHPPKMAHAPLLAVGVIKRRARYPFESFADSKSDARVTFAASNTQRAAYLDIKLRALGISQTLKAGKYEKGSVFPIWPRRITAQSQTSFSRRRQ
jgi:hypothetical protein